MGNTDKTLDHAGRIKVLREFMTDERAERMRRVLDRRTNYITVCTENFFHPQNASALIRHCDAFGLQDIHTVESVCRFKPNVDIVRGTDKWVNIHRYDSTEAALDNLKLGGYRVIATAPHISGTVPEDLDLEAGPVAVVFGTEHEGITPEVRERADGFIQLPMQGFVESLNVSACAAIVLYILSERLRRSDIEWRLDEQRKEELLSGWMIKHVHDSERILRRHGLI